MMNGNQLESDATSFGDRLRRLRRQHAGRQFVLIANGLRCTDAAVSAWERGRRLPSSRMLANAIAVLVRLGATNGEIEYLRAAWVLERIQKRSISGGRHSVSEAEERDFRATGLRPAFGITEQLVEPTHSEQLVARPADR
jgi:transcriptional regulator with XRE-family HTH domain